MSMKSSPPPSPEAVGGSDPVAAGAPEVDAGGGVLRDFDGVATAVVKVAACLPLTRDQFTDHALEGVRLGR
jgi:hypothetical protein